MSGFKEPDSLKRQEAAAIAKKAALEKFRAKAADPALADRLTERAARAADRKAIKDVREAEKRAETKSCETERAQQFIVADQPTALVAELNNSAEQAAALNSARRGRQANGPRARVDPKRSRPFLFCFGAGALSTRQRAPRDYQPAKIHRGRRHCADLPLSGAQRTWPNQPPVRASRE
jgi:hypothetical protein